MEISFPDGLPVFEGASNVLYGAPREEQPNMVLAGLHSLVMRQQQQYGNGEQPPLLVQQQPYHGPPLRFCLTDQRVRFCYTKEDVLHHYVTVPANRYAPVPEYAARLQGPLGTGIVRARINSTGTGRTVHARARMRPQPSARCATPPSSVVCGCP